MSDVRELLSEVTDRPVTHPDPVSAVHTRVRRRAARRRVAAAAGTSFALVAAGFVYAARPAGKAVQPASPTASTGLETRFPREWRRSSGGVIALGNEADSEAWGRGMDVAHDNPADVVGVDVRTGYEGSALRYTFRYAFSAGVDPADWAQRIEAAIGPHHWESDVCDRTAFELDRMASEAADTVFPSGAAVHYEPAFGRHGLHYGPPCTVIAELTSDTVAPADAAYARATWGTSVRLVPRAYGGVIER